VTPLNPSDSASIPHDHWEKKKDATEGGGRRKKRIFLTLRDTSTFFYKIIEHFRLCMYRVQVAGLFPQKSPLVHGSFAGKKIGRFCGKRPAT